MAILYMAYFLIWKFIQSFCPRSEQRFKTSDTLTALEMIYNKSKVVRQLAMSFAFEPLLKTLVENQGSPRLPHLVQSYHTKLYSYINSEEFNHEEIHPLFLQLDQQMEFYHDDRNKDILAILSQPILISIAKNYVTLLSKSKVKLFDITNKFVTVYSDLKKATNLRNLSAVILCYIYESFGKEVSSFIPLIITTALKQLKKEKSNLLNLAILFTSVVRNGGALELNDSIVTKYHKLLKTHTEVEILAALYGSLGVIATYKKTDLVTFKSTNILLFQQGLAHHEKIRHQTAKSLAEALLLSGFTEKEMFEVFFEIYIDGHNPKQQIGIVQSIIHYHHLKFIKDPDYIANNFSEVITNMLSVFTHERVISWKSNGQNRLIEHSQTIFESLLKMTTESTQKTTFNDLLSLIDKQPSVMETLAILQFAGTILENISGLSDSEIELYHIKLWKLSTSNDISIRVFSIQVLKAFAKKFPRVIRDVLETSLNELINNSKQSSSTKVFDKSHGYSLILANLISLADKDYVPESFIHDVWRFSTGIIKQDLPLDDANYQKLVVCWIALIGVFTYDDPKLIGDFGSQFIDFCDVPDSLTFKSLDLICYMLTAILALLKHSHQPSHVIDHILELLGVLRLKLNILRENTAFKYAIISVENKLYQIYLLLINTIKIDDSSVLIQAIKCFSDLPNYEVAKNDKEVAFSDIDDGFSNGITSKFRGFFVDELSIKFSSGLVEEVDYSIDHIQRPAGSIGLARIKSWLDDATWLDTLESSIVSPVWSSLVNDPFQPIFGNYSLKRTYAPPEPTSIIDSTIEIFAKVFPSLTTKVQLSLLETLRSHLLSKSNNTNTKIALSINISIVIHGLLTVSVQENQTFDQSVGTVLLETLRNLYSDYPSKYLLTLNSESIGIIISKTPLIEQIPIFIKQIVDNDKADLRAFNALLLSSIYQYNASHFTQILEVLSKLAIDPHPYVHAWSLDALSTIIDKHLAINSSSAIEIISILENVYLSDKYGRFTAGLLSDLNADNDSNVLISRVLRSVVNSLGPGVKDLDPEYKQTVLNLVHGLFYNTNEPVIQCETLRLIQELIIFDTEAFKTHEIVEILKFSILNNAGDVIGSNLSLPTYESINEVFCSTSSFKVLKISFDFLSQLVKTSESKDFMKELEYLVWFGLINDPQSPIINNLIKEWIDSTYDLNWFIKLQKLFNSSKTTINSKVLQYHIDILNKYEHKKIEVDVKDEEAQSIAKDGYKEDDQLQKTEAVDWQFKIAILKFIKQMLGYTLRDSKLHYQISSRISDLIKISYSSSTSSVLELRLLGIDLLGDIIAIYAESRDPIYPEMSLLEQQQAQITSALIPAFQINSTPLFASHAIKVVATFIGSSIVSVSRLARITKILINSLDDLQNHDDDELKINEVVITSEIGKRRVKLAVLNAWAELMVLAKDEELANLVNEHLDVLLPLWISTLKEYEILKHGNGNTELYDSSWINIVDVIGVITEKSQSSIIELLKNDILGFYYLIYSDCMFSLLGKNSSEGERIRILKILVRILKFKQLVELIFHDDIFHETIEILERLIITGSASEKLLLVDILSSIFMNYFESDEANQHINEDVDKLFEILRMTSQPIIALIPLNEQNVKTKELEPLEIQILKNSCASIIKMISKFPNIIRYDLFASVLSVIERAYTHYSRLVPQLIPILKEIMTQLSESNDADTINNFYQSIKSSLSFSNVNSLLTISVLITATQNHLKLNDDDVQFIVKAFVSNLLDTNIVTIITQTIKTMISQDSARNQVIFKNLIPLLVVKSMDDEDSRISTEILILITKSYPSPALYTILIPCLLNVYHKNEASNGDYVHRRLLSLVSINPDYFKLVINNSLNDEQRALTERLVKLKNDQTSLDDHQQIKLKTFE